MQVYNANYWDDRGSLSTMIKNNVVQKHRNRVSQHNREIIAQAEYRAGEMIAFPSKLEERMQDFLNSLGISYVFQKIFYIYADDGWIIRYYIADFYVPEKDIIIEVDGKFHDNQKLHDKKRTKTIQESYPEIQVLRYTWNDMSDGSKMEELMWKLKN